MKTKEFIKSVEVLGFQTHVSGKKIKVCDEMRGYGVDDPMFILISDLPEVYIPNKLYMSSLEGRGVLKLIVEYLDTPNSEREEEKRYWLQKIPVTLLDKEGEKKWLWKYTGMAPSNVFGTDTTKIDDKLYQTIFTESEIEDMDIAGFEKVEVEE